MTHSPILISMLAAGLALSGCDSSAPSDAGGRGSHSSSSSNAQGTGSGAAASSSQGTAANPAEASQDQKKAEQGAGQSPIQNAIPAPGQSATTPPVVPETTPASTSPTVPPAQDPKPEPKPETPPSQPISTFDTPGGVYVEEWKIGAGPEAGQFSIVKVHYVGTLATDGKEFDSSIRRNEPLRADLSGRIIKGWKEAIPGMKVGGRRVIVIPPELAYGPNPVRGPNGVITIPANSTLVFDIELLEILE